MPHGVGDRGGQPSVIKMKRKPEHMARHRDGNPVGHQPLYKQLDPSTGRLVYKNRPARGVTPSSPSPTGGYASSPHGSLPTLPWCPELRPVPDVGLTQPFRQGHLVHAKVFRCLSQCLTVLED